jgi:hypothetical protein
MLLALDVYADDEDPDAPPAEKKEEGPSTLKTLGSIGLGIVGLGIVAIPAAKTFSSSLSYAQAKLNLVNLLRTNPNQAEMMAKQMEGTFAEAIAATMKMGGAMVGQDASIIAQGTAPTYDAHGQGIVARLDGAMAKGKMGLMAAVGGAALGLSGGALVAIPIILALLTIAAFLRLLYYKNELQGTIIRARAEILPEVNAALVSGRYIPMKLPGM